jgi:hypothetical protein
VSTIPQRLSRKSILPPTLPSGEEEMGVFSFIEVLEKYAPEGLKWDYIHYKCETHNSLGFKSICAGFELIYKDWKIKEDAK